ncbi:Cytochrome b561 domain-containing protein 1 [Pleurostoma richardsiae]|uniref:Cytochrome b561 domain-containing protein 1 n=1 Tax=Pleurostoma richardsiae TaxID=41990 RepID=A0AA38RL42_9PEZI|nr:Cytochrome b561 domain-containing protein 1 [Pleurostoma richardsiae]
MASATGIPATAPDSLRESEPLLGRPGDVLQKPDESMLRNLYAGTGWLAQAGILLLVALVWSSVFLHPLLPLFSPHPLLQSVGVLFLTEAILVLQPTWTPAEKVVGQRAHTALNLLSFLILATGVAIIEANKIVNNGEHFHSVHGYLGVATAAVLAAQYAFGFLMWGVPGVFGGLDRAKALWKYHRATGYLVYLLLLATVLSATQTPYNWNVLGIKAWAAAIAVVLIIAGVYPRIHLRKFGLTRSGFRPVESPAST